MHYHFNLLNFNTSSLECSDTFKLSTEMSEWAIPVSEIKDSF